MAWSTLSIANVPFKIGLGYAHTSNSFGIANEADVSAFILAAQNIWSETINSNPVTAQAEGICSESVILILEQISGVNAYYCKLSGTVPATLTGKTNPLTGTVYATGQRVGHIIPKLFGNSYLPILKNTSGTTIGYGDTSNWFLDPFSGIITQENALSLGATPTLTCRIYTGKLLSTHIENLQTQLDNAIISGGGIPYSEIERLDAKIDAVSGAIANIPVSTGEVTTAQLKGISAYLQSEIDNLQVQIYSNDSDISSLQSQIDNLVISAGGVSQTQLNELRSELYGLSAQHQTLRSDYDAHVISNQNDISSLSNTDITLQSNIDSLSSTISNISSSNTLSHASFTSQINGISAVVQQNTLNISTNTSNIVSLQNQLDSMVISAGGTSQTQFNTLTAQVLAVSAANIATNNDLLSHKLDNIASITVLSGAIDALVLKDIDHDNLISALQTSDNNLNISVSALSSNLSTISSGFNSRITSLESQVVGISAVVYQNTIDIAQNSIDIVGLQNQIDVLVVSAGGVSQTDFNNLVSSTNSRINGLSAAIDNNLNYTNYQISLVNASITGFNDQITQLNIQNANQDNDIATLSTRVDSISGLSRSELAAVSGYLQSQINVNSANISGLQTISAAQNVRIGTLENTYTPLSTTAAISAYLNTRIDNISVTGDITRIEVAGISGNLQSQINVNSADISGLRGISGNHEIRISNIENTYITESEVAGISAYLLYRIENISGGSGNVDLSNYLTTSQISGISAYLQSQITAINSTVGDISILWDNRLTSSVEYGTTNIFLSVPISATSASSNYPITKLNDGVRTHPSNGVWYGSPINGEAIITFSLPETKSLGKFIWWPTLWGDFDEYMPTSFKFEIKGSSNFEDWNTLNISSVNNGGTISGSQVWLSKAIDKRKLPTTILTDNTTSYKYWRFYLVKYPEGILFTGNELEGYESTYIPPSNSTTINSINKLNTRNINLSEWISIEGSSVYSYSANAIVLYNGELYRNKSTFTIPSGSTNPSADTTNWELYVPINAASKSLLNSISGGLNSRLSTIESSYITKSQVAGISAYLQGQVTINSVNISGLQTISAAQNVRIGSLENTYITKSEVGGISAYLQSQITDISAAVVGTVHKYSTTIGNNSTKVFTVTHSLNTSDIFCSIRDLGTGELVDTDVVVVDINNITTTFTIAPTLNQYKVTVIG